MYYSRAHRLLAPLMSGYGSILMLHHVRPQQRRPAFAPNAGLEVTPEFLDKVLEFVRGQGIELVSFAEGIDRIRSRRCDKRFAVLTLDDGYLDNFEYAWPVFKKHECPFTIFVASDITDGKSELWWQIIEDVIQRGEGLKAEVGGESIDLPTETAKQKHTAFQKLEK